MKDGNTKKSKFSWSKSLIRKWFNIRSKSEDYVADEVSHGGGEFDWRNGFPEREPYTLKKSKIEKSINNASPINQGREYLEHPRIVDVQNHSVFVGTWNVGGKSPPSHMNLDEWIHAAPPADMYVLGFQEIVPLNASNILGAEDHGPCKKWIALIRKTLNNVPGTAGSSACHTPSPIPKPIIEVNADFEGPSRLRAGSVLPRRSFQATSSYKMDNEPSVPQPRLDRRYSVCDRAMFGHRRSDYRPSNYRPSDFRPSDARASDYRPSDYNRPSDCRRSDFSRWGSSDDDFGQGESPSTVLFSPMSSSFGGSTRLDDGFRHPRRSRYCLVVSKQMVGIFLTVWIRKDLRDHVRNVKVSCIGRGLMGYLGNKGSISVSMLLKETSFCFVCSHLTSGQKEGDELRRNSDVMEILKKTRFPRVTSMPDEKSPETITEHDRIIWLGDLNYRLDLSYRSVRALVEMQNWRALLERDQLRRQQKRGRAFSEWYEGNIYFPPTYKYLHNSDRYAGDDMQPSEKRRTPAWCDRILWYGRGLHQLSYFRAESRFSDHRPVCGMFWAEVESVQGRLKRTMSCSSSRVEISCRTLKDIPSSASFNNKGRSWLGIELSSHSPNGL
ncbi:LOW QUALITY PROTEIN: hypothetical protein V2J09_011453 [Rumex salicifolius]